MKLRIKNSIEYWGKIPSTWDYIEIRYGFHQIGSGTTPTSGKEEYYENGSIPWINTSELREKTITEPENYVTPLALEHFSALKIFNEGTLLVAMYGATIGRMGILGVPACVNQAVCALSKPINLSIDFTAYALQASKDYLLSLASGGGQPNLNAEKLVSHKIPCPPLEQQQAIASYLDQKTSTIDQLIAAKQTLITLLNEKRQALITHAITRGIDHQAPLKDSGVEWIGEIPAHWEIKKLNTFLYSIQQGWSPLSDNQPADKNEWGVLKVGAVNNWTFNPEENKKLPNELDPLLEYQIYDGDVLISRANTTQLLGSISIVEGVNDRKLLLCDKIYRISLNGIDKRYIFYYLRSKLGRALIEENANGASNSMQNISQEDIKNILLTIPPLAEQTAIVAYIERETQKLDALKTAAERTIALLRERRSALIHAAVTGQIDVD